MPTLYRKYRPSVFADVIGQDTIVKTLQNEISGDKLAHAYLFSGPRGVGKTTLARLLAKSVGCEKRKKGNFEPCNACPACEQINIGRHIDIIEIDAASQTGVDNVRENIISNANILPTSLKYKIFIIDEVHMLSNSSFNALLKSLEEPPSHVIFILATTELHKLPATVVSRCQKFIFKKISFDLIISRLKKICSEEKIKVEKEVLERIARKSDGGLRDAESLLGQILSLDLKSIGSEDVQMILPLSSMEKLLEFLESIAASEPNRAIVLVNELVEEGVDLNQFAYDLLETLRAALLISMNANKSLLNPDFSDESVKRLRKLSAAFGEKYLIKALDLTLKRKNEIKFSPIPQMPLEILALEISEFFENDNNTSSDIKNAEVEVKIIKKTDEKKVDKITISPVEKEEVSPVVEKELSINFDSIKSQWQKIIEKASETVPTLSFILTACSLKQLSGATLEISVPYSIHKDKLETPKNRQIIEKCLKEILSENIKFSIIVAEDQARREDHDLTSIAAEFGGEIVG